MGDRMLNSRPFAQRGASTLRPDFGAQLALALFVLTDVQAPALADPGFGALRALWTRITGAGGKLGVFACDHWHSLATRTGDCPVRKVQSEIVFGEKWPSLRPGAGDDVHALLSPLHNLWTRHVPQINVKLQQTWGRVNSSATRFTPTCSGSFA